MVVETADEIIFVLPTRATGQLGPVAALLNTAGWVEAASRLGYRPTIVTPNGLVTAEELRRDATPNHRTAFGQFGAKLPTSVKTAVKDVREWARSRRFSRDASQLVLLRSGVAFVWQRHELFARAGERLARRLGCPLVVVVAAPKVWEARRWGVRRVGWAALAERLGDALPMRKADVVACVSAEVADAVAALGVDKSKIIVTPSTADTTLFHPGVDGAAVRRDRGLDEQFVIGWTGSFRPFHGLEILLGAAQLASRELPNLRVLLVGDGPERSKLEHHALNLGVDDIVQFAGMFPQTQLPAILAACDMATVTSRSDQAFHYSPLKMWEYLAMGLPVAAPSIGVPARMLRNRINAMLYEPGSVQSLASVIILLAGDAQLRAALGVSGRSLAESESWEDQFGRVLEKLNLL